MKSFNNDSSPGGQLSALLLCVLTLSASGLAGAHGAPEADNIPAQRVTASIENQPGIDGFSAMIVDAPRPAIFVTYRGEGAAMVQGMEGEPFLRFTDRRVMANTLSKSWQQLPDRQPSTNSEQGRKTGETRWVEVSASGSYGWLDPRLGDETLLSSDDQRPLRWSIPVLSDAGGRTELSGMTRLKSIERARAGR